jgi:hypothetical protein
MDTFVQASNFGFNLMAQRSASASGDRADALESTSSAQTKKSSTFSFENLRTLRRKSAGLPTICRSPS